MGSITINYQNAALTSNSSTIMVTNGTFALQAQDQLSISGTVSFSSLYIAQTTINFAAQRGAVFTFLVEVPVNKSGSGDPSITVSDFSGTVAISWLTNQGQQYQELQAGNPITLDGYSG